MSNITTRLYGKGVESVTTNGHLLKIRCLDGSEYTIAWLDDNGVPIKGKPVLSQSGVRMIARGLQDLIHLPNVRTRGAA